MHDCYPFDRQLNSWFNEICILASLLACSTFLFVICAKKSHKTISTVHCLPDASELDTKIYIRPIEDELDQPQPRPSAIYKDILTNPKKTDLIRLGKLKVDKRNPDYDTLADIDREVSLDNIDEVEKKLPKSNDKHTYEILLSSDVGKSVSPKRNVPSALNKPTNQQPPSKLATPHPRRESTPHPAPTSLPRKTASKSKIVIVNPHKRVSINEVQGLVLTRISKSKKESKMQVEPPAPETRRHSIALGKVDSRVGVHDLKPSHSCGTNLWMQRNQQH